MLSCLCNSVQVNVVYINKSFLHVCATPYFYCTPADTKHINVRRLVTSLVLAKSDCYHFSRCVQLHHSLTMRDDLLSCMNVSPLYNALKANLVIAIGWQKGS